MQPSRVAISDGKAGVKAALIGFGFEAMTLCVMISDIPFLSSIAGLFQLPFAMLALIFLSNDPRAKWAYALFLFVTQGSLYACFSFVWLLKNSSRKV